MKITVITPCLNSAATIESTIKSVLAQNFADLEYIIVDGGSTDGTLEIIERYHKPFFKVITEKDSGLYDAMNKGVRAATGDVVGILNSDDFYYDSTVLKTVAEALNVGATNACYGDLQYVDRAKTDSVVRFWRAGEYSSSKLKNGWIPPHPTFFVKKSVYNELGVYRTDMKIAADYELMLRFLLKKTIIRYIPKTLVCMREGGVSAQSFAQRMAGWNELKQAWKYNGQRPPILFIARRVLFKMSQYFVNSSQKKK